MDNFNMSGKAGEDHYSHKKRGLHRTRLRSPFSGALTQPSTLLPNPQTEDFPLWFAPAMHGFGGFQTVNKMTSSAQGRAGKPRSTGSASAGPWLRETELCTLSCTCLCA